MSNTAKKTLFVSDFDDTLAQTDANVYVTNKGTRTKLSPAEFAVYTAQHGDEFDFSEFDKLINPRPIERFVRLLKLAQSGKADKVVVLTARGHTLPVVQFLRMQGITSGVSIAALGDANPQKKADYIQKNIDRDGYTRVAFIDDSPKNVDAVKKLREKNPNVRILVHHAKEHPTEQPAVSTDKRASLKQLLQTKIRNPKTNNDILIKTALAYDKNHPVHIQAIKTISAHTQHHNIRLKKNQ